MDLTTKKFKIKKTERLIKKNDLFIFCNSTNKDSKECVLTEQELKKTNINYKRIFNKTSKRIVKNSIFLNSNPLINSITFLLKFLLTNQKISKKLLFQKFETFIFSFLAIKINNKIYSKTQIKSLFSLNYKNNNLLFYKYLFFNIKTIIK